MRKLILAVLAAGVLCSAPARGYYGGHGGWGGRGGWGWGGLGVGLASGFILGSLAYGAYTYPYYDHGYYGDAPYYPAYYYPSTYSYASAPMALRQPAPAPADPPVQSVPLYQQNYNYNPGNPMNGANSLFGR